MAQPISAPNVQQKVAHNAQQISNLQDFIRQGEQELTDIDTILAASAGTQSLLARSARIIIIVSGAVAATNGTASKLFGENNITTAVVYAVIGVIIATIGGIEAAYKFDSKSASLKNLCTKCRDYISEVETDWTLSVCAQDGEERYNEEKKLVEKTEKFLHDIRTKATDLGVNLELKERHLKNET